MADVIHGSIYDYPVYYDLLFGSDWKAEFDFLTGCFDRHAGRPVRRLFEPACGTGRLLIKLARAGFDVGGNDLNSKAVDYCNNRLERYGFGRPVVLGDMSDFRLRRKADAAFNTINSFRHLSTDLAAESHLQCVADALHRGGLYILGLHLLPTRGARIDSESWSARRGNLGITSHMWTTEIDTRRRVESLGMTLHIYTPTGRRRIVDHMEYRTWTAAQLKRLLCRVPAFELVETCDFAYDLDTPFKIDAETEDVVLILRKRENSGLSRRRGRS